MYHVESNFTYPKMYKVRQHLNSEKLADINKTMNDLESTWRSDAATDIRAAMNALKPRFEEYKTVVESYAKFLVNTAQSYDVTETSIQNNAGAFK